MQQPHKQPFRDRGGRGNWDRDAPPHRGGDRDMDRDWDPRGGDRDRERDGRPPFDTRRVPMLSPFDEAVNVEMRLLLDQVRVLRVVRCSVCCSWFVVVKGMITYLVEFYVLCCVHLLQLRSVAIVGNFFKKIVPANQSIGGG